MPHRTPPESRDVHGVVQLVEQRDEVLPRHRPHRAPIPPAALSVTGIVIWWRKRRARIRVRETAAMRLDWQLTPAE